ncbi:hypothetical protein D3C87_1802930 [compost metagenome]
MWINIQPEVLELQPGFVIEQRAIDDPALVRQLPQIDVLRHRHFRHQMQFLINNGDPGIQRRCGIGKRHLFTA